MSLSTSNLLLQSQIAVISWNVQPPELCAAMTNPFFPYADNYFGFTWGSTYEPCFYAQKYRPSHIAVAANAANTDRLGNVTFDPALVCDIAFVGVATAARRAVINGITNTDDIRVWGHEWAAEGVNARLHVVSDYENYEIKTPQIYRAAKISLNLQTFPAATQRIFEVPAAGGFVMSEPVDDLERLFPGGEIPVFHSVAELDSLSAYYLKNDTAREATARRQYERVQADHSYRVRIAQMLSVVEKQFRGFTEQIKKANVLADLSFQDAVRECEPQNSALFGRMIDQKAGTNPLEWYIFLARYFIDRKKYECLPVVLERLKGIDACEQRDLVLLTGRYYYGIGEYKKGRELLSEHVAKNEGDLPAVILFISLLSACKEFQEALRVAERVLERDPAVECVYLLRESLSRLVGLTCPHASSREPI